MMNERIGSSNLVGINNRDPLDFASSKDYSQIPQITQIHLRVILICEIYGCFLSCRGFGHLNYCGNVIVTIRSVSAVPGVIGQSLFKQK